jgi:hypothetical protein
LLRRAGWAGQGRASCHGGCRAGTHVVPQAPASQHTNSKQYLRQPASRAGARCVRTCRPWNQ